jgi:hypothetical protein
MFSATEAEEWLGWSTNYSIRIRLSLSAAFGFSNFLGWGTTNKILVFYMGGSTGIFFGLQISSLK